MLKPIFVSLLASVFLLGTASAFIAQQVITIESPSDTGLVINNTIPNPTTKAFSIYNSEGTEVFFIKGENGNINTNGVLWVNSNQIRVFDSNGCAWLIHVHTDGSLNTHAKYPVELCPPGSIP